MRSFHTSSSSRCPAGLLSSLLSSAPAIQPVHQAQSLLAMASRRSAAGGGRQLRALAPPHGTPERPRVGMDPTGRQIWRTRTSSELLQVRLVRAGPRGRPQAGKQPLQPLGPGLGRHGWPGPERVAPFAALECLRSAVRPPAVSTPSCKQAGLKPQGAGAPRACRRPGGDASLRWRCCRCFVCMRIMTGAWRMAGMACYIRCSCTSDAVHVVHRRCPAGTATDSSPRLPKGWVAPSAGMLPSHRITSRCKLARHPVHRQACPDKPAAPCQGLRTLLRSRLGERRWALRSGGGDAPRCRLQAASQPCKQAVETNTKAMQHGSGAVN